MSTSAATRTSADVSYTDRKGTALTAAGSEDRSGLSLLSTLRAGVTSALADASFEKTTGKRRVPGLCLHIVGIGGEPLTKGAASSVDDDRPGCRVAFHLCLTDEGEDAARGIDDLDTSDDDPGNHLIVVEDKHAAPVIAVRDLGAASRLGSSTFAAERKYAGCE